MAQCPVCRNNVKATFGMSLCPKCQTPLFFDFDGNPQVGDTPESPSEESSKIEFESGLNLDQNLLNEDPIAEQFIADQFGIEDQPVIDDQSIIADQPVIGESIENQPIAEEGAQEQFGTLFLDEAVNSDIDGNSQLMNGQFFYDIEIEGIDGTKLRNELFEELKDPHWGWVSLELMGEIKMGRLTLKNINAIKASLLVNRLKALPLEIKWKQVV